MYGRMETSTTSRVTPLRAADPELIRTPPYNNDAEQHLLGALLISKSAHARVSEFLHPEHFGYAVHGRIFAAIGKLMLTYYAPVLVVLGLTLAGAIIAALALARREEVEQKPNERTN